MLELKMVGDDGKPLIFYSDMESLTALMERMRLMPPSFPPKSPQNCQPDSAAEGSGRAYSAGLAGSRGLFQSGFLYSREEYIISHYIRMICDLYSAARNVICNCLGGARKAS